MRFRTRRELLFETGGAMTGMALAWLLNGDGLLAAPGPTTDSPFAPKKPHFPAKAKRVISLFMSGGVSQMDTFDPKPALQKYAGQPLSGKGDVVVRQGHPGPLMPSPFTFKQYGQSGLPVSNLFPKVAQHVDDMAVIRTVVGRSNDHVL